MTGNRGYGTIWPYHIGDFLAANLWIMPGTSRIYSKTSGGAAYRVCLFGHTTAWTYCKESVPLDIITACGINICSGLEKCDLYGRYAAWIKIEAVSANSCLESDCKILSTLGKDWKFREFAQASQIWEMGQGCDEREWLWGCYASAKKGAEIYPRN